MYLDGGQLGPRTQRAWQLVYTYEGCIDLWINRKPKQLVAGEIILLKPGQNVVFHFNRLNHIRHGWCRFDGLQGDPRAHECLDAAAATIHPFTFRMRKMARAARAAYALSGEAHNQYLHLLCYSLLQTFLGHDTRQIHRALRKADALLQTSYSSNLSLPDLAAKAGITPGHLIRLYHTHFHITPIRRLWAIRVEAAKQFLCETGLPISDIATKTGFRNPHHFSRVIKETTGYAPMAYRNQAWLSGEPDSK